MIELGDVVRVCSSRPQFILVLTNSRIVLPLAVPKQMYGGLRCVVYTHARTEYRRQFGPWLTFLVELRRYDLYQLEIPYRCRSVQE